LLRRVGLGEADDLDVDEPRELARFHDGRFRNLRAAFRTDHPDRAVWFDRRLQLLEPRQLRLLRDAVEHQVAFLHGASDRQKRDGALQLLQERGFLHAEDGHPRVRLHAELLKARLPTVSLGSLGFSLHGGVSLVSWRASRAETARSRTAPSCAEWTGRSRAGSARADGDRPSRLLAAPSRRLSESSRDRRRAAASRSRTADRAPALS